MRLTSLADYAVVVMAAAARHPPDACLSAGLLAEETGVPRPTSQKVMSRLASAGLLVSTRGSGGGFRLARPAGGISLADIIEAVEGPIAMTNCIEGSIHDCALEGSCRVKSHLNVANDAVRGALAAVSLAQLAYPPVRPELVEGLSFTSGGTAEERGFDKLSPNGVGTEANPQ